MNVTIHQMMTGAIAMAFAIAALFFLRFWRETRDRLFGFFALSYAVLALNRVFLGIATESVREGYLYWVRLSAFAIILLAILDKNRARPPAE